MKIKLSLGVTMGIFGSGASADESIGDANILILACFYCMSMSFIDSPVLARQVCY